jgi:hypothetical protein
VCRGGGLRGGGDYCAGEFGGGLGGGGRGDGGGWGVLPHVQAHVFSETSLGGWCHHFGCTGPQEPQPVCHDKLHHQGVGGGLRRGSCGCSGGRLCVATVVAFRGSCVCVKEEWQGWQGESGKCSTVVLPPHCARGTPLCLRCMESALPHTTITLSVCLAGGRLRPVALHGS